MSGKGGPASRAAARSISQLLRQHDITPSELARGLNRGQSTTHSWTTHGTQDFDVFAEIEEFLGEGPGAIVRGMVRDDGRPYISPGASISAEDAIRRHEILSQYPRIQNLVLESFRNALKMIEELRKAEKGSRRKAS